MIGAPATVRRADLAVGGLLAEGGEGRVHELAGRTGTLVKLYRSPIAAGPVGDLVAWLAQTDAALAARVAAASAWPSAVVAEAGAAGLAGGVLLPRAPRRFSLRHRDGQVRLATLSYLTSPPGHRVAAYGLALPPRFGPERLGIVYALARLLEAWQSAEPAVSHGDLSARNVLWSLERGPEVFVLDCDSAETDRPAEGRRRAMTPNWDDPAVAPGANPTAASDRYSLALVFLRVAGAAHFPIQKTQRTGGPLHLEVGLPPAAAAANGLGPGAPVWDLCERSLSVAEPDARPPASAWAAALEQILDELGAMRTVRAVWAAQGGGRPGPTPAPAAEESERARRDVRVLAIVSSSPERTWTRSAAATPRAEVRPAGSAAAPAGAGGYRRVGAPSVPQAVVGPPSLVASARHALRVAAQAWLSLHRQMLRTLATPGRRGAGVGRLLGCVVVNLAIAIAVVFGAAMLLAPVLHI